jgi:hypothetical protein
MGFGYGPKMSQYRVDPADFLKGPSKAHVRYLGPDDKQAIAACYDQFVDRTHGMMYKTEREMRSLFRRQENQFVGVELHGQLRGYLVYTFEQRDDFTTNDIHVQEWIYETPEALAGTVAFRSLCAYGRAQIWDNGYVDIINRLLAVGQKPTCMTRF